MSTFTVQLSRRYLNYFRLLYNVQRMLNINKSGKQLPNCFSTSVDAIDAFTTDMIKKHKSKAFAASFMNEYGISFYLQDNSTSENREISLNKHENVNDALLESMFLNKHNNVSKIINDCLLNRIRIDDLVVKKIFQTYSLLGNIDVVKKLTKYMEDLEPNLFIRNGNFVHYLAKAEFMKGNSEKGLSMLRDSYAANNYLRGLYRTILKELLHDSVLNRSEATMVIFKKYVMEFSENWQDHYPLVCYWHICWISTWFSDQTMANDLFDSSQDLRWIVKDRAVTFTSSALRNDYNEDATVRLLQSLLKYNMIEEYTKVLEILFSYKLKNRDIRGCKEILKNCEVLGIVLPAEKQGKYIRMLIEGKDVSYPSAKPSMKNMKFKF